MQSPIYTTCFGGGQETWKNEGKRDQAAMTTPEPHAAAQEMPALHVSAMRKKWHLTFQHQGLGVKAMARTGVFQKHAQNLQQVLSASPHATAAKPQKTIVLLIFPPTLPTAGKLWYLTPPGSLRAGA